MTDSKESPHTPAHLMARAKEIKLGEGQKTSLKYIVATIPYGTSLRDKPEPMIWYPDNYRVPTIMEAPEDSRLVYELPIVSPNVIFEIHSGKNGKDVSQASFHGSRPVVLAHMAIYETPEGTGKVRFVDPWGKIVETNLDAQELLQAQNIPDPKARKEIIGVTDARKELADFFATNMPTIDVAITHITANKPLSSLPLVLAK